MSKPLVLAGMVLMILTIVFLAAYGLLIFFYFVQWNKLRVYKPAAQTPSVIVSIIVAARNEEDTLPLLLQDLTAQTYPQHLFEIIIVDDYS
ncbi:MAG TPA: glycosyltransferase, partial [Flavisolibacter sp.]|nr:glycosyltransferase [Flavisolibacter sp.]